MTVQYYTFAFSIIIYSLKSSLLVLYTKLFQEDIPINELSTPF